MHWQTNRPKKEFGEEDKGHPEVSQCSILSVTLCPPSSSFHRRGLLWIFSYSPLDPALINLSYKTCIEASLMTTFTTSFFLITLSHSVVQTKTSTSLCIQGVIYEVLTVCREATEREFYQQQVFLHLVLWKLVELLDTQALLLNYVYFTLLSVMQ